MTGVDGKPSELVFALKTRKSRRCPINAAFVATGDLEFASRDILR
jgi:hypothetical protein